jgi:uncharacterized membrane protein YbhN (UPF0104 family)
MGAAADATPSRSGRRRIALKLAVSAAIVAAMVALVPWAALRDAIAGFPPSTFLLVAALFLGCHVFGVVKWRMVIRQAGARLRLRDAFECYGAGMFANLFLPSIIGGDVLRALLAGRRSGRMEGAVLGGAADRLLDLIALCVLVVGASAFVGIGRGDMGGTLLAFAAAVVAIGSLVGGVVLLRRPLRRWPARFRRRIAQALVALRRQGRRPSVLVRSLLGGVAMQGALVALNALLGRALGIKAPASAWVFAWALAKLAGLLPASFNGIGVRDGVFAVLFAPLVVTVAGAPAATLPIDDLRARALAASFLWQGVLIAGSLVCGAAWFVLRRGTPRTGELEVRHG